MLGWVDLWIFMRGDMQSANFGYLLHNQYWGQGYGREAAKAAAIAAFRKLGLHRLEASISPRNKSSIALIRALGFRREGLRKKSDWNGKGWEDSIVYSAIPEDFGLPNKAPRFKGFP
jgi:ribosomal-protein-alanine N-acetyltransferase